MMNTPLQEKEAIYIGVASSASLRDATYWLEIIFASGIARSDWCSTVRP